MQVAHSPDLSTCPFEINRIGEVAGTEIIGLDIWKPIDEANRDAIYRAFLEHHVLVFRDQSLTKDEQTRFSENFGHLEKHVGRDQHGRQYPIIHTVANLDKNGKQAPQSMPKGNYFWHTDKSYHAVRCRP